jgi:CheY-like chemotaxis protein
MSYVLVVDDEELIRKVLRRRLKDSGYQVKEAANAVEALEMMLMEPAAVALIDHIGSIEKESQSRRCRLRPQAFRPRIAASSDGACCCICRPITKKQ